MSLTFVPLITAALPILAINISYLLAASQGHVPWCIPYFEGCTSISATGRQGPEAFVFRGLIVPTAVLLMLYWKLCYEWLKSLGGARAGVNRTMLAFGVIAALALIVYATVLGAVGEGYKLQRRGGVMVFYVFTILAQVLLTWQVARTARGTATPLSRRSSSILIAINAVVIGGALFGLVLSGTWEGYGDYDDSVQWSLTTIMLAHVAATYFAWKDSGFHASFKVAGS